MKNLSSKLVLILNVGIICSIISGCGSNSLSKNETKSFEGQKIEEINIKTGGQNIEFRPSNGKEVTVKMKAEKELPAKVEDNVLSVVIEDSSDFINFKTETLYVDIPKDTYKKINLVTTSGNITGEDLKAEKLILTADSGEININGFEGDKVKGEVVSGNVKLVNIMGDLSIENDTGNVSVSHKGTFKNDSSISSNSGEIEAKLEDKPNSLQIDAATESGKIKTSLFSSKEIITKDAGSKLKSEIGSEGPTLSLHSSSGNINID
ncbi:DUF4097 family beta strand repeat-containing protein [Niallia sp. 03190]|uniref:DUF4097 family beta strand repeat-containing protein n=1 Tax=Niallia sp. 03190 TaxID=3458061 RepID=UPI004043BA2A